MKDFTDNGTCERADDLISFFYDELSESEASDFQHHLLTCGECHDELESFGRLKSEIGYWKQDALAGFRSAANFLPAVPQTRSAMAAIREFFDLSPLWLKGAVGFVSLLFCLLAVIALSRLQTKFPNNPVATHPPTVTYTQDQVNEMVANALAEQKRSLARSEEAKQEVVIAERPQKQVSRSSVAPFANSRRPLSKAERAQLAADLRLTTSHKDEGVNLLADRINE